MDNKNNLKGRELPWYELAVYWIANLFSFGALWIAKIIVKKAFIEAVGKMEFNIYIDTPRRTVKVEKSN